MIGRNPDNPLEMGASLTERILDRALGVVISMDQRGLVTYWNPTAETAFGIPRETAVGRHLAELIIPERLRAQHTEGLERFLATGEGPVLDHRVEMPALRGDGTEFPIEMTVSALNDGGSWTFHAFARDISARRASESEHDRLVGELRMALRGAERRFDAIVGSLGDPVTIRNRANHLVYANRAALDLLGLSSVDELRETSPEQIMADYIVAGEDGRPVTMDDIPSVRLLRGEDAEPLVIRTVHRDTGELHWQLLKASPLLDDDGEIEATIMIFEDITERKRAERQAAFLAQVSGVLGVVARLRADAAQCRRAGGPRCGRLVRRRPARRRWGAPAGGGRPRGSGSPGNGRADAHLRAGPARSRARSGSCVPDRQVGADALHRGRAAPADRR